MAQVRVKSALQNDYVVGGPFNFTAPNTSAAPIFYPKFKIFPDRGGRPCILIDSSYSTFSARDLYAIYYDDSAVQPVWRVEDLNVPNPQLGTGQYDSDFAFARDPTTGRVHFATYKNQPASNGVELGYWNANNRFPRWKTVDTPNAITTSPVWLSLALFEFGNPVLTYAGPQNTIWHWDYVGEIVQWPVVTFADSEEVYQVFAGTYQDSSAASALSPVDGVYFTSQQTGTSGQATVKRALTNHTTQTPELVSGDYQTQTLNFDVFFLGDTTTAPLLVEVVRNADASRNVIWITNKSYGTTPLNGNTTVLFADLPSGNTPVWATVLATGGVGLEMTIYVFAAFQESDGSLALWYTRSILGSVAEIQDGIFDVMSNGWSSSTVITKNILSRAQYQFDTKGYFNLTDGVMAEQPFRTCLIGDSPCVVVMDIKLRLNVFTLEMETGVWNQEQVLGLNGSAASTETQVYYTEISAVDGDGTAYGGVLAKIGSDSAMDLEINGRNYFVNPNTTVTLNFDASGILGVTVPANGLLLPPSFWIWFEGMDDGARIDILPGGSHLQETLDSLNTTPLNEVTVNGNLLVPQGTDTTDAQKALLSLSDLIGGDQTTVDPATQTQIYKSTSPMLARVRPRDKEHTRLGRIKPKPGLAFRIGFKDTVEFEHLTSEQLSQVRKANRSLGFSLFDDIGDFFEDVENQVCEVVSAVVEAVEDAVQITFTFVADTLTKLTEFTVELASQIAEVALMVFDAIKVPFQSLFEWLAYIFNWGDILATQAALTSLFTTACGKAGPALDALAQRATAAAFASAQAALDQDFTSAESELGAKSVNSLTQSSAGESRALKNDDLGSGVDVQGTIDDLPAAATWLLQKVKNAFGIDNPILPTATGMEAFNVAIESIKVIVKYEQVTQDWQNAEAAFKTFASTITDRGIFDGMAISAMLTALKSVAKLGLDIAQAFSSAIVSLFNAAITQFSAMFTEPITSGLIQSIYSSITGTSSCTFGDICSLIIAVPYTIIYKVVTGQAPYGPSSVADSEIDRPALHRALGALTIVESVFATVQELAVELSWLEKIKAFLGMIGYEWLDNLRTIPVNPPEMAVKSTDITTDTVDDVLTAIDLASMAGTIVRIVGKATGSTEIEKVCYLVKAVFGMFSLGGAVFGLVYFGSSITAPDLELLIGSLLGGFRDTTYIVNVIRQFTPNVNAQLEEALPKGEVVLIIIRAACGLAQAALYFVAAATEPAASNAVASAAKPTRLIAQQGQAPAHHD